MGLKGSLMCLKGYFMGGIWSSPNVALKCNPLFLVLSGSSINGGVFMRDRGHKKADKPFIDGFGDC